MTHLAFQRKNDGKVPLDREAEPSGLYRSVTSDTSFSDPKVESRWWGSVNPEKWKKPDVSAVHDRLRVAFEIQLSTTFVSVMADRRKFYLENGGLLVWIFKSVHTDEIRQFQDDIFYNNNSNIFVVDEETVPQKSARSCHYLESILLETVIAERWREKLVSFSELIKDQARVIGYLYCWNMLHLCKPSCK